MLTFRDALKKSKINEIPNFAQWVSLRIIENKIKEEKKDSEKWLEILDGVAKSRNFKSGEEVLSIIGTTKNKELKEKALSVVKIAKATYNKTKK